MKNQICICVFLISASLFSCNHNKKNAAPTSGDNYEAIKSPEQCFTAIYQKDTAFLKFKTMPNGKIQGDLVMKYGELQPAALTKEFYRGKITGQFTKDTLFADYTFTNDTDKTVYRNPIALLKRDNKLILGVGATKSYLGRTWFIDHRAINFNNSRFQFVPGKCK
jgi:hypothetical protein